MKYGYKANSLDSCAFFISMRLTLSKRPCKKNAIKNECKKRIMCAGCECTSKNLVNGAKLILTMAKWNHEMKPVYDGLETRNKRMNFHFYCIKMSFWCVFA